MTTKKTAKAGGKIKVKLTASVIGGTDVQRATVRGLGLRKIHQVVEREDTPMVRGMISRVAHLVTVVE
jgi:large subunit ribosomal protein L30